MKKLVTGLVSLAVAILLAAVAMGGTWTPNQFIYKPEVGARGAQEKGLFDTGLERLDTRLGNEIWLNDAKYGGNFQTAINEISSSVALLRVPRGTWNIGANLTLPTNITLKVEQGATLSIADGKTLTVNGGFEAPLSPGVFALNGSGKVNLAGIKKIECIWFASGAGASASPWTDGFRHAYNGSGENHVYHLQAGTWQDASTINVTADNVILQGDGKGLTHWHYTATDGTPLLNIANGASQVVRHKISDIGFSGADPTAPTVGVATGTCIATNNLNHSVFSDLSIDYFNAGVAAGTSKGISHTTGYNNQYLRVYGYKTSILLSFEDGPEDLDWDLIHIEDFMSNASDPTNNTYGIKLAGKGSRLTLDGVNEFDQVRYGIHYVNDALTQYMYGWRFSGCYFESYMAAAGTAVTLKVGATGGGILQNVEFQNCNIGTPFVTAFDLDGIQSLKLTDVSYGGSTGKTWIAATDRVYPLTLENCTWSTNATFTLASNMKKAFGIVGTTSANDTLAVYVRNNTSYHKITFNSAIINTIQTLTYSPSIDVDTSLGNFFKITVTDGVAYSINNPTNVNSGQELKFIIKNSSGGDMGDISWGNKFIWTSGAAPLKPQNGKYITVKFTYDGSNWVEDTKAGQGYTLQAHSGSTAPNNITTYYFGSRFDSAMEGGAAHCRIYIPTAGTIRKALVHFNQNAGTSETSSIYIRLNNSSETLISAALTNDGADTTASNNTLNIPVAAGDYLEIKWVTPTWVTQPTGVYASVVVYITS
jgi:hypothetical protein